MSYVLLVILPDTNITLQIKYWALGNEVWGPWQVAQMTKEEYAHKAYQWAKGENSFAATPKGPTSQSNILSSAEAARPFSEVDPLWPRRHCLMGLLHTEAVPASRSFASLY